MVPTIAILTIEKLDPNPIEFVSLELEQFIMDHARVLIKLDLKQIGESVFSQPMQKTSLIGEKFHIDIQTGSDMANAYGFLGLITDVQVELDAGDHGWLYIYGASQSIELERGKMLQTYSGTTLKKIVDEVTGSLRYLQITKSKIKYMSNIPFSFQYYETDYQYLKRLAWMYGEKLFFSGDSLVMGDFDEKPSVKVTYDKELKEVKFNSRLIANKFQQYYHETDNTKTEYEHPFSAPGTFIGDANAQSEQLNLRRKPDVPIETPVKDFDSLQSLTEMRKKTNANRMFFVSGKTKLYKVRIGGLLEIDFHDKLKVDENPGTLRVTRVKHVFTERDEYYNEFEACQKKEDFFPYPEIDMPVAHPVQATVVDNFDEDLGLGRVQLQFDFEKKTCDYWFPCLTPDGGGNSQTGIPKNRGFQWVPEIKDKVIISFINSFPDKPFVMGSMFHEANASTIGGAVRGNHIKSIRDKSGSEVVFNDKEGSIKFYSPKGKSTVHIDGKGNVSIRTPNTITLSASNINLNASNSINLKSNPGKYGGEGTIDLTAHKTIDVKAETESISLEANTELKATAPNTTVEGKTNALVTSDKKLELNGGLLGDFHATIIKIN